MKIETKFNLGDRVRGYDSGRRAYFEGEIGQIVISKPYGGDGIRIEYDIGYDRPVHVNEKDIIVS